jgi:hypothetical protein
MRVIAVGLFLNGCTRIVDPPLDLTAIEFSPPPVYTRWWKMTEACSGRSGSLAAVTWYQIPGNTSLGPSEDLPHANWSAGSNRIVLAEESVLDGSLVRHEMLHALRQTSGHARSDFLERCGGVVRCSAACIADAGSPPRIDPATVAVTAKELAVAFEIIPTRPSALEDSGVFSVIVKATNSRSYAVVIVGSPRLNFGYQLLGIARQYWSKRADSRQVSSVL